jgi:hypothetical protein
MRVASALGACAAAGLLVAHPALAVDVDVTITPNGPGVQQDQFNDSYNGWEAVLPAGGAWPDARSVWGNSQGFGWPGNPSIADLGGIDGLTIRSVAHGSTAGSAVLEDRFATGNFRTVTLSGTFRVKFTNNTVQLGQPVLSVQFSGGPGISLNIGDKDYPANADNYWYQLVQYKTATSSRRLLMAVEQFPLINPGNPGSDTVQEDPSYKTARIVVDKVTNAVQLWWNGVKVYDQVATPFSSGGEDPVDFGVTSSTASWGCDTTVQPLPAQGGSGSENRIWWHEIRIQGESQCGTPSPDADRDTDVDMNDFGVFQQCFAGTGQPFPSTAGGYPCTCFDRNQDQSIDQADFVEFQNCATRDKLPWSQALTPMCAP